MVFISRETLSIGIMIGGNHQTPAGPLMLALASNVTCLPYISPSLQPHLPIHDHQTLTTYWRSFSRSPRRRWSRQMQSAGNSPQADLISCRWTPRALDNDEIILSPHPVAARRRHSAGGSRRNSLAPRLPPPRSIFLGMLPRPRPSSTVTFTNGEEQSTGSPDACSSSTSSLLLVDAVSMPTLPTRRPYV